MTETNTDEMLKEFLQDDVPCEGGNTVDGHPADIYAKFDCEHCDDVLIGPVCIPHHESLLAVMAQIKKLPCLVCGEHSSLDAYSVVGPIR